MNGYLRTATVSEWPEIAQCSQTLSGVAIRGEQRYRFNACGAVSCMQGDGATKKSLRWIPGIPAPHSR